MENAISYLIYIVAYVASMAAFAFNSIFWLRALTVISSVLFVVYYYLFPIEPMWLDIFSESALVVINLVMILLMWYKQKTIDFTEEEKELFHAIFPNFNPFEYFKLIKAGSWMTVEAGQSLIGKDKALEDLFLIYHGSVNVAIENQQAIDLSDGYFIGERSFNTGELANATVSVTTPTQLIKWDQQKLKNLLNRNPGMKNAFHKVINEDLSKKLYS